MMKFYVKDMSRIRIFMPIFSHGDTGYALAIWHPELKLWQNVLCNSAIGFICSEDEQEGENG